MLMRLWREDEGVLTLEWILLLTLLVIGIVGGLAGVRDALILECENVAFAIDSVNPAFQIGPPLTVAPAALSENGTTTCADISGGGESLYTGMTATITDGRLSETAIQPVVSNAAPGCVALPGTWE